MARLLGGKKWRAGLLHPLSPLISHPSQQGFVLAGATIDSVREGIAIAVKAQACLLEWTVDMGLRVREVLQSQ